MRVVVLAAGKGIRMKSKLPKVLHPICGKAMLLWVLDVAKLMSERVCVVLGYSADTVREILPPGIEVRIQQEQLGTAHAVMSAEDFIDPDDDVLILYGDMPLIKVETLRKVANQHKEDENDVTIVSTVMENATGYGRIVRDLKGDFVRIVEEADAADEEKMIREVNTGIYVFKGKQLLSVLPKVNCNNAKGEYYLTDVVGMMSKVGVHKSDDWEQFIGINDKVQLALAHRKKRFEILERLMLQGVTIIDPETTYVDADVEIGCDTILYPMTLLLGRTKIGEDCVIGPMTKLENCLIGNRVRVINSDCVGATIEDDVSVGPFARLREGTVLKSGVKIGNFVEVKNSKIGSRSKAQHLAYLGDATVGEDVNVGAGTITCNFDGKRKNPTFIDDGAFVGSNCCLIAPLKIGKGAFIAAGSVITEDVPEWSLAIARCRQVVKPGWVIRKKEET
ncbi:bifunctional UDP-N-acetylglucosamine diphosphorylase/glucosamine-1-phosphate N-acetyltransferase GlmU [Pseudothermotoga sp.]|uniref:bifunctional UDP-N-acetylglucosamine diphosphorylase/glucosamine-1-phosphate N-acetyltransferase GlmU n=1 Tax=Pseudothermotoga sp. TaxID=2033661 RepID=UPI0031F5FEDF